MRFIRIARGAKPRKPVRLEAYASLEQMKQLESREWKKLILPRENAEKGRRKAMRS